MRFFFGVRALSTWFELVQGFADDEAMNLTIPADSIWKFHFMHPTIILVVDIGLSAPLSLSLPPSLPPSPPSLPPLPLPIYIHVQQSSIPWYLHRHPSILWSTYSHNIHFIRTHKYTIIQSKKNQRNLCHIWIHVAVATVNMCWSTGIIHTIVYMHIDGFDMGLAEIGDYISCGGWLSISYNFGPGGLPAFLDKPTSFLYPLYPHETPW